MLIFSIRKDASLIKEASVPAPKKIATAVAQAPAAPRNVPAAPKAPSTTGTIVYQWTGAGTAPYKNERLAYWQSVIRTKCTEKGYKLSNDEVKLYVMQSIQENGSLDPLHTSGDGGKAVGLPQRNVKNAKAWLSKNPEWNDWKTQYNWWADKTCSDVIMFRDKYKFKDPVKFAIIYHNRPASAIAHSDQCLAGPTDYNDKGNDCYFGDQVKGRAGLLTP